MPEDSPRQGVRRAKCGAQNPHDAPACQSCGAGLSPTAQEQKRVRPVPRLLLSLLVGFLVLVISACVSFWQFCGSAIRIPQELTLRRIAEVGEAIEAYRHAKHVLP